MERTTPKFFTTEKRTHREIERRIAKLRGEWRECGVRNEEMDRRSAVVREDEWEVYGAEVKAETEKRKERQRWQEKERVRKRKAMEEKITKG